MSTKRTNKKTLRKKRPSVPAHIREHRSNIRDTVKELKEASASVLVGVVETQRQLPAIAKRIMKLKEEQGLKPSILVACQNFTNVSKALTILDNDLKRIDESWSPKGLEALSSFDVPMFALQVADQYIQLATLLTERFLPAVLVMDEALDSYVANGQSIKLIPIGAPTKEHHEDGTTTEHTAEEAQEHLDSILNPTEEEVEKALAE